MITQALIGIVRVYQYTLRPFIGAQCRFEPHCSAYAIEALTEQWVGRKDCPSSFY